MNVLHINCNYMTTVLHQTMIEHLDAFTKNTVICPFQIGREGVIVPNDNVRVLRCFNKYDRLFYFIKQKKILDAIEQDIKIKDNDLVHAYTLMTDGNIAYNIKKKYGIPYVVAIRDTDLYVFFRKKPYLINRGIKIMENASKIFFLSEPHKQEMLEKYIPNKIKSTLDNKMYVIPNGIDDFWLDNKYLPHNSTESIRRNKSFTCICVGQVSKRKNIPTVQSAIQSLNKEGWNVELHVIGKIVDNDEFKKINPNTTKYHPPVDKTKLIEYYRSADIFVLASLTETFGLVYAEAMSQGVPVIYTSRQGFDGQFAEGVVGYSVKASDSFDITQKIKMIINNYDKISKNTTVCVDRFDWGKIVEKYHMLYIDALSN